MNLFITKLNFGNLFLGTCKFLDVKDLLASVTC